MKTPALTARQTIANIGGVKFRGTMNFIHQTSAAFGRRDGTLMFMRLQVCNVRQG
jgi:hypothetical protein